MLCPRMDLHITDRWCASALCVQHAHHKHAVRSPCTGQVITVARCSTGLTSRKTNKLFTVALSKSAPAPVVAGRKVIVSVSPTLSRLALGSASSTSSHTALTTVGAIASAGSPIRTSVSDPFAVKIRAKTSSGYRRLSKIGRVACLIIDLIQDTRANNPHPHDVAQTHSAECSWTLRRELGVRTNCADRRSQDCSQAAGSPISLQPNWNLVPKSVMRISTNVSLPELLGCCQRTHHKDRARWSCQSPAAAIGGVDGILPCHCNASFAELAEVAG